MILNLSPFSDIFIQYYKFPPKHCFYYILQEEQIKYKGSRIKEIIKIKAEINDIEKKKSIKKNNKINNPIARLTKKKRERTQISNSKHEKEDIITDPMDIKRSIKEYYEQLCRHVFSIP